MIFKDDRSIYIESNRKEMDDGVKEGEKMLENSQHLICRQEGRFKGFKHPKLFLHTFRIVK